MENITITFLGTGNAIPTKKHSHTAILLNYKNENILIDCGEGTQRQFRIAGISPAKLTKILITHKHGDHIFGLPGLFQTLALTGYGKTLEIFGPRGTKEILRLISKIAPNYDVKMQAKEISTGKVIDTPEYLIESATMNHGTPTLAYSFTIKDKLRLDKKKLKKLKLPNSPLLRKLQEGKNITYKGKKIKSSSVTYLEKGKKVTIILDTKQNPNTLKIAKNSDLIICESSFSEEEKERASEYKHLTAKQAAQIAKKSKSKALILTHLSQRYEYKPEKILAEAKKTFKNTKIANDFDSIIL